MKDQNNNDDIVDSPCKRRKLANDDELPNVIKVALTHDKCYVVTVTVPDKCVRVHLLDGDGRLKLLSERY